MNGKLKTYYRIMKTRYELIYSRKILAEEIRNRMIKGEADLLFLKYVRGNFVRDMVLNTAHMYEWNTKNYENVNLHRLLRSFEDFLNEHPKKNEKLIKKCVNLIKKTKEIRKDELSEIFSLRNGFLAHSDYRFITESAKEKREFNRFTEEMELALNHAQKVFNLIDPEWKLNTINIDIALEDLKLTIRLIEDHKEYVNLMIEAEREESARRHIFDSWENKKQE